MRLRKLKKIKKHGFVNLKMTTLPLLMQSYGPTCLARILRWVSDIEEKYQHDHDILS